VEKGNLQMAQLFNELKKPDSAFAFLQLADKGPDSTIVGDVALSFGNAAQRELKPESPDADYTNVINYLTFADANATSKERGQQAKFLIGAVSVKRGQALLKAGVDGKNCQLVKQSKEQFAIAQVNVPAGGRFAPDAAGKLMSALGQLIPAAEQAEKAICKP
jgi:hypothetical protein